MSHAHAKEIFNHAAELPVSERAAYLEQACHHDDNLRVVVESLLKYHDTDSEAFSGRPGTEEPDFQRHDVIGPYQIMGTLGEGGMGIVYLAEQAAPVRRQVAIKVLKPGMDSRAVLARFQAEQQAMALMDHPGIATVLQTGMTASGRPWFAMEFIEGVQLGQYCDSNRLNTSARLDLFASVCDAVQHAHQKGVIHRDLKPSNILVSVDDDGKAQPRIIDFGIAKAIAQPLTDDTLLTTQGQLVGTLAYMSPEQMDLSGTRVDTRTDVYALGVILYELLSGRLPFETGMMHVDGLDAIRRTIRDVDPPKPSTRLTSFDEKEASRIAEARRTRIDDLERELRRELEWIPLKALRKEPSDRYASPESLAADVRRYLSGEPLEAGPPSHIYRLKKTLRRYKVPAATIAGFVVLLIAATAVSLSLWWSATQSQKQAELEITRTKAVKDFVTSMLASVDPRQAGAMDKELMKMVLATASERLESGLGTQPLVEADIHYIIGTTYHQLGLHEQAEKHLVETVIIRRRELSPDHSDTLEAIMEQANLAMNRGQYSDAEAGYRETLTIRRIVLGKEHPDTLESQANLGELLRRLGRLEEAQDLVQKSMEANRRVKGHDHPHTLNTVDNMGILMAMQGRYEDAEVYFNESLQLRLETLGEDHPATMNSMGNMATLYWSQGKNEEALAQYEWVLAVRRRVMGDEHPSTLSVLGNLAGLLQDMDRLEESESLHREVLQIKQRVLGEEHPSTLKEYIGLGALCLSQARLEEAEHWFRLAWDGRRKALGDTHPDTLSAKGRVGMVMRDRGQFENSEQFLTDVYETSCQRHGAGSPDAELLLKELILLYDAWDRPADVQRCRTLLGGSEAVALVP